MSKQEEIREGTKQLLIELENGYLFDNKDYVIDAVLGYLSVKGAVLEVEMENGGHPQCAGCYWQNHKVEPLIEENEKCPEPKPSYNPDYYNGSGYQLVPKGHTISEEAADAT